MASPYAVGMLNDAETTPRTHSGTAVLTLILGIAAVIAPLPLNTAIAVFAILTAFRARSELRADPTQGGTVASVAGFLLALGALIMAALNFWLPATIGTIVMGGIY